MCGLAEVAQTAIDPRNTSIKSGISQEVNIAFGYVR